MPFVNDILIIYFFMTKKHGNGRDLVKKNLMIIFWKCDFYVILNLMVFHKKQG